MYSIVIPAFNEEKSISTTISNIRSVMIESQMLPFEIIVVDDGSTDNTSQILSTLDVVLITHPHNIGYGRALKDGISAAKYQNIIITDADNTYPAEAIPHLKDLYLDGYDMVVANRNNIKSHDSIIKQPLRSLLKFIVEFTAGRKIPDINSGMRIFNKYTSMRYFEHLCNTFSFTTSLTLSYMMNGKFVAYFDIDYGVRIGKTKVSLLRDSILTMQYIIESATYYNPLKIFSFLAFLCLILSFISIANALILQLVSLFLLGVGAILLSILIFAIGLLAVLLKQIMNNNANV